MFEDFQKQATVTPFSGIQEQDEFLDNPPHPSGSNPGLTPKQRFTIAILVLMLTVAIGILLLLTSAKVVPPFLG